jgi:hypothetical protein
VSDIQRFVGAEISFDCQPYDTGRGRITQIEQGKGMWDGCYAITVEVIEGKTRNRLFGAVSYTDIPPGSIRRMYHYRPAELEAAVNGRTLIYVYPV